MQFKLGFGLPLKAVVKNNDIPWNLSTNKAIKKQAL